MFSEVRQRLMRIEQIAAGELRDELYAMFGPKVPLSHKGPITLTAQDDKAPITVRNLAEGDVIFQFQRRNGEPLGQLELNDNGEPVLTGPTRDATEAETPASGSASLSIGILGLRSGASYAVTVNGQATTARRIEGDVTGFDVPAGTRVAVFEADGDRWFNRPYPTSMPGRVVSGSGTTYTVTVYPNGLAAASVNVSVRQLQLASGETIPAGTGVEVAMNAGAFTMQVPVWL